MKVQMTLVAVAMLSQNQALAASPAAEPVSGEPLRSVAAPGKKPSLATGWGLGASAGITSGFGISTRKHFKNRWGAQMTGVYLPLAREHWLSLGGQAYYTILHGKIARFYGLAGVQLMSSKDRLATASSPANNSYTTPPESSWDHHLFPGLGLGLEFHFTRTFGWAIEVPLSARVRLNSPPPGGSWRENVGLVPAANTSLMFYFR